MNVKFVNEAKSKQRKKNRTAVHKQTSLIAGSKKGGSSQDCSAHNAATAFCLARRLQPSCVGMCMP